MDVLIFSQLASMSLCSPRNFSSRFQLCFDFAMHYGTLYCPFKTFFKKAYFSEVYLEVISVFSKNSGFYFLPKRLHHRYSTTF